MPRWRIGTPAATSSAPSAKQMTSAVPMSGCFISSAQARADHDQQRLAPALPSVCSAFGRAASSCAE